MNFLNGYKQFKFLFFNSDNSFDEAIEFDLKHQAMRVFLGERYTEYDDITGVTHQKFLDYKYLYELNSEQLVTKENMIKYERVLKKFMENKKVFFQPHVDAYEWNDEVVKQTSGGIEELKEISNYIQNENSPGHKGFILKLKSRVPFKTLNWIDTGATKYFMYDRTLTT